MDEDVRTDVSLWGARLSEILGTSVAVSMDERAREPGEELSFASISGLPHAVAFVAGHRVDILVPQGAAGDGEWAERVRGVIGALRLGAESSRRASDDADSLLREQALGRDESVGRYSRSLEHAVDQYIRTHSEAGLRAYLSAHPILRDAGRLADGDRLRGLKDLMISILAVATRTATDAGTTVPVAFGISDYFIREIERAASERALDDVLLRSLRALADSVTTARHLGRSALVRACEEWIFTHLDGTVRPSAAAAALGVRQDYLVAQFRRETGMRFAEYVFARKVDEAKTILTHTDLPIAEICRRLGFYDQSHLIRVFRRFAGDTPHRYRVRTTGSAPR